MPVRPFHLLASRICPEYQKFRPFNCGSPTTRIATVRKIERDFLPVVGDRRILDVGGTSNGFVKRALPENRSSTTIVNPYDRSAAYLLLKDVPAELRFDLIMMFGVLNELQPDYDAKAHFQDARARLAPDGVFLVAEPLASRVRRKTCLLNLIAAGFEPERIQKRHDLRPGWSATFYYIFSARN